MTIQRKMRPECAILEEWAGRLRRHRARIAREPQFNAVKQLAYEISRTIESGELELADVAPLLKALCDTALVKRAQASRLRLGAPLANPGARIAEHVRQTAGAGVAPVGFERFAAHWQRAAHGIVFTAHPTFAMARNLRTVLVQAISGGDGGDKDAVRRTLAHLEHEPDRNLDLAGEHDQAQEAIAHAQEAIAQINGVVIEIARELYPSYWRRLVPQPVSLSSWVGYDLDGRTDISWQDSIRMRLDEKLRQVRRHIAATERARADMATAGEEAASSRLAEIAQLFREVEEETQRSLTAFDDSLEAPDSLSQAAEVLTARKDIALRHSVKPAVDLVTKAIEETASDDAAASLVRLRASLLGFGFGTARIHFRVNANQIHNAIRRPLGAEAEVEPNSRVLLNRLDEMIMQLRPESVNFASLAIEPTTVVRQFILMAQILKHIDADAPIRLLIAECEHPFTALAAVYFAKLVGIEHKVDVSPLLETEAGLHRGPRLIENLLKTQSYRQQVQRRGRLAVQTGFSDSGRLFGQVAAGLAVERLQAKLAEVVAGSEIGDVEVLVFDTHGESMGRGAHPASLADRFLYVLSPWVRAKYAQLGVRLAHEVSFQGGDGYVWFGSTDLALATLENLLAGQPEGADARGSPSAPDPFYEDIDFSWDFYAGVKQYQARLFEHESYVTALTAFGTNLLPKSGSRRSQRQYDAERDSRLAAAEMRAIPHNAILQQLGMVVNVVSGVGTVLKDEIERFAEMYRASDRARRVMTLVAQAHRLSSIKSLVAYAGIFDDAFWVTRPLSEPELRAPCLQLAKLLRGDRRHDAMMHLASYLRDDALHLDDLLRRLELAGGNEPDDVRDERDILHALRLALVQHIYLLAARVPRFSPRNDISQADVMSLVFSLRVDEAVEALRQAFPTAVPQLDDYRLSEPASYTSGERSDYGDINRSLIDPMAEAYRLILQISVGLSHHYGAHG